MDFLTMVKSHFLASVLILVPITLWLYYYTRKGFCKSKARLDGKTVIVTGGNSGIGKETAFDLAKRGARVIIASTNLDRADSVKVVALVLLFVVALWIYLYIGKGVCKSKARLDGKTVIVTGCDSGIGKATAFDLARRGARVIMACINWNLAHSVRESIIKETNNTNVDVKFVDLSQWPSIRKFAKEILETERRLDVLIHNAGVLFPSQPTTPEGLNMTFAVNVYGPFLLTHLLMDLIKETANSRIVIVASCGHFYGSLNPDNPNPSVEYHKSWHRHFSALANYCASKLAVILFAVELSRRLEPFGTTVNSVHPGCVGTSIVSHPLSSTTIKLITMIFPIIKTPEEGAQTSIYVAVSEKVEGVTGKYFSDCKETPALKLTSDKELANQFWEVCKSVVELQPSDPQI